MTPRVFLDVGGHLGQTVEVVLNGVWNFDEVHTFEPDPDAATHLETAFADAIAKGRLTVHRIALSKADGLAVLVGDNKDGGASIVDAMLVDARRKVQVRTVDINAFLSTHFPAGAWFWIKLNCEGGEADIVERLCGFERRNQIVSLMADFDIVKKAFGYYRKRSVLKAARAAGLKLELSENVMVGKGYVPRTENWLAAYPELLNPGHLRARKPQRLQRRIKYWLRDMRSAVGLSKTGYR
jgi:FkbM family methyltransferase